MRSFKEFFQYVGSLVTAVQSEELTRDIALYTKVFDEVALPKHNLSFFSFHVEVPRDRQKISYKDVQCDHSLFDYQALMQQQMWAITKFNPGAHIIFVTDLTTLAPPASPNVTVVRLNMQPAEIMFERVKAMTAYVLSKAFCRDTVFLDTDAFPNRPLAAVFDGTFDVGVTRRQRPGYMPINEGVIFASAQRCVSAHSFFKTYIGTYERMIGDRVVRAYYGDIKRWRGGQLSLSAVSVQACPSSDIPIGNIGKARVATLPCEIYNYTVRRPAPLRGKILNTKFILHLKGEMKKFIESVAAYQRARTKPEDRNGENCTEEYIWSP